MGFEILGTQSMFCTRLPENLTYGTGHFHLVCRLVNLIHYVPANNSRG